MKNVLRIRFRKELIKKGWDLAHEDALVRRVLHQSCPGAHGPASVKVDGFDDLSPPSWLSHRSKLKPLVTN